MLGWTAVFEFPKKEKGTVARGVMVNRSVSDFS